MKNLLIHTLVFTLALLLFYSCTSNQKDKKRKLFFSEMSKIQKISKKPNSPLSHLVLADYHPHYEYFTSKLIIQAVEICEKDSIKALFAIEGPLSESHFKTFSGYKYCTLKQFDTRDTSQYRSYAKEYAVAYYNIFRLADSLCQADNSIDPNNLTKENKTRLISIIDSIDLKNIRYHWQENVVKLNNDVLDIDIKDYDIIVVMVGGLHAYYLQEDISLPTMWSQSFQDKVVADKLTAQLIVAQWLDLKGF